MEKLDHFKIPNILWNHHWFIKRRVAAAKSCPVHHVRDLHVPRRSGVFFWDPTWASFPLSLLVAFIHIHTTLELGISSECFSFECRPGRDSKPSWIAICQQQHPGVREQTHITKVYLLRILGESPWVFLHKGPTRRKPRFKNVDALGTPKGKISKKSCKPPLVGISVTH